MHGCHYENKAAFQRYKVSTQWQRYISDTCLRHFHLHESYAYYIAPTCWLPWELSSSVAGNKSKLLLLVICHPASTIVYVHRTIVFWPRGHFVCLRFQLYDTRSRGSPPMPSEPKSGTCRDSAFQMGVSLLSPSVRCRVKCMAFVLTESKRTTHKQKERRVTGMVYSSEELIRKGMSLITAIWREVSLCSTLSSAFSTCSRSGREGEVSDMTSSEVSMSGTAGDWGRNQ